MAGDLRHHAIRKGHRDPAVAGRDRAYALLTRHKPGVNQDGARPLGRIDARIAGGHVRQVNDAAATLHHGDLGRGRTDIDTYTVASARGTAFRPLPLSGRDASLCIRFRTHGHP